MYRSWQPKSSRPLPEWKSMWDDYVYLCKLPVCQDFCMSLEQCAIVWIQDLETEIDEGYKSQSTFKQNQIHKHVMYGSLKTNQSVLNPPDCRWIGVALLVQLYWGILIAQWATMQWLWDALFQEGEGGAVIVNLIPVILAKHSWS